MRLWPYGGGNALQTDQAEAQDKKTVAEKIALRIKSELLIIPRGCDTLSSLNFMIHNPALKDFSIKEIIAKWKSACFDRELKEISGSKWFNSAVAEGLTSLHYQKQFVDELEKEFGNESPGTIKTKLKKVVYIQTAGK